MIQPSPNGPMRIAVLGGGVIGVCSAYCLAREGHQVELTDAADDVALGASGSNAGLVVPPDSIVWNTPDAWAELFRAFVLRRGPISVRPTAGPGLIPWGMRFLAHSTRRRSDASARAAEALSSYSARELQALASEAGVEPAPVPNGMVFFARDARVLSATAAARSLLAHAGHEFRQLTPEELARLDPGFARTSQHIAGALYAPDAASGDCAAFTRALAAKCRELGVRFRFAERVTGFDADAQSIRAVHTTRGRVQADAYVLALGARSPEVARTAGLNLPVVPVKGYALTAPIGDDAAVPRIGGVDEGRHVAFSRHGSSLRLSTGAEFAGFDEQLRPEPLRFLEATGRDLFGDAIDWSAGSGRSGFRPVSADGVPYIGRSPRRNLFVNAGHGHLGWTQAAGSARLLADLIAGRPPAIDPCPYLPDRRSHGEKEGLRWRSSS
ncbi:MAG TPA: FAD-dependent oxidoreductase [Conexibacter sp.]|nr:FAD-dependent oxidoreductase [Conexibacter sp.]